LNSLMGGWGGGGVGGGRAGGCSAPSSSEAARSEAGGPRMTRRTGRRTRPLKRPRRMRATRTKKKYLKNRQRGC
jgi:hypothetical protein